MRFNIWKGMNMMHLAGMVMALVLTVSPAGGETGILVMAHGGDGQWNADVERAVAPLRDKYPIEIAFGMARTSTLREAVTRLEGRGVHQIAVVRLFISGESFLAQTEYILGLRKDLPSAHVSHSAAFTGDEAGGGSAHADPHQGHQSNGGEDQSAGSHTGHHMEPAEPIATQARIVLSEKGVGDSPLVDEILADRVKALSVDPSRESVLILAHGPADEAENERWLANMRLRVQKLHSIGPFRHVECETLREDWPDRRALAERRIREYVEQGAGDGGRVLVIPFRVAGFGPYAEILAGLEYVSDGRGFCPHPNITRWIEETARGLEKLMR